MLEPFLGQVKGRAGAEHAFQVIPLPGRISATIATWSVISCPSRGLGVPTTYRIPVPIPTGHPIFGWVSRRYQGRGWIGTT
jgi:hypothetical protein